MTARRAEGAVENRENDAAEHDEACEDYRAALLRTMRLEGAADPIDAADACICAGRVR